MGGYEYIDCFVCGAKVEFDDFGLTHGMVRGTDGKDDGTVWCMTCGVQILEDSNRYEEFHGTKPNSKIEHFAIPDSIINNMINTINECQKKLDEGTQTFRII